jgi:hypothetical protein
MLMMLIFQLKDTDYQIGFEEKKNCLLPTRNVPYWE